MPVTDQLELCHDRRLVDAMVKDTSPFLAYNYATLFAILYVLGAMNKKEKKYPYNVTVPSQYTVLT